MSDDYDYGPLRTYEITWQTGHIETVQGHQVIFGSDRANVASLLGGALGTGTDTANAVPPRFTIHGALDGKRWHLVLAAPEADVLSIRDVTDRETAPGSEVQS